MSKPSKVFQSAVRTKALPVPIPRGPQKKTWYLDETAIEGSEKPPTPDGSRVTLNAKDCERMSLEPADAMPAASSTASAVSASAGRSRIIGLLPPWSVRGAVRQERPRMRPKPAVRADGPLGLAIGVALS